MRMGPASQGQNDNGNITPYPVPRILLLDTKFRLKSVEKAQCLGDISQRLESRSHVSNIFSVTRLVSGFQNRTQVPNVTFIELHV